MLLVLQWATFHEIFNQLEKWVQDTERILLADVELQNTLPEKKDQLQKYKVSTSSLREEHIVDEPLSEMREASAWPAHCTYTEGFRMNKVDIK